MEFFKVPMNDGRRGGSPEAARHKAKHQEFLTRFDGLTREVENGRPATALLELCASWLKDHILGEDRPMAAFLINMRAA